MDIKNEIKEIIMMDNDVVAIKNRLFRLYTDMIIETGRVRVVLGSPEIKSSSFAGVLAILSVRAYPDEKELYIPAIKYLRQVEGIGLKEAKDLVDYIKNNFKLDFAENLKY